MIRRATTTWLLAMAALAAAEREDLLRFTNGDQLHGTYLGIKDGPQAVWRRDDVPAPVEFKTTQLRHIVLHGGRPQKPLGSLSHLGLVNGDRIPGTITGIDAGHITMDTPYAGALKIPRAQVSMMAPNPMGGRVSYFGPFTEDEWKMIHPSYPDGLPPVAKTGPPKDDEDAPGRWEFSGSAWYWKEKQAGTALIHENGMPERAVLRFDLAWKNRLSISIGFHTDFMHPKPEEDDEKKEAKARAFVPGDTSDLPRVFGNGYVLQMYSSYLMLFRTSVDEDGKTSLERVQLSNNNLRLGDAGQAKMEIRSNRRTGGITLFVNDEFVAQWNESEPHAKDAADAPKAGSGFGFIVQGDETPVRISDVVVSEWNGMPDSARSLQVDDQDVVLMSNGTDRYAGRVGTLDDQGKILFEGKHGQFRFPLEEVAEIRFARERLAPASDAPADSLVVRLSPIGSISGRPVSGDASMLAITHPIIGPLNLAIDSAVMIDFNSSNQIIDDWDAEF